MTRATRRPTLIVVTGSENTGKTTLAAQLAAALGTAWVPEYARAYAELAHRPLTADDVAPIAIGQRAAEDRGVAEWRLRWGANAEWPPLVLDTDLISTTVYAEHYNGACPEWIMHAARVRMGSLYLLCEPDLPWSPDGVRDRPTAREQLHAAFRDRLRAYGATVAQIRGSGDARLLAAMSAVAALRPDMPVDRP